MLLLLARGGDGCFVLQQHLVHSNTGTSPEQWSSGKQLTATSAHFSRAICKNPATASQSVGVCMSLTKSLQFPFGKTTLLCMSTELSKPSLQLSSKSSDSTRSVVEHTAGTENCWNQKYLWKLRFSKRHTNAHWLEAGLVLANGTTSEQK